MAYAREKMPSLCEWHMTDASKERNSHAFWYGVYCGIVVFLLSCFLGSSLWIGGFLAIVAGYILWKVYSRPDLANAYTFTWENDWSLLGKHPCRDKTFRFTTDESGKIEDRNVRFR
jgi:hypothetical protein